MAKTIPIAKSQDRSVNTTPSNREAAPIENRQIFRPNKRIPQRGEYQAGEYLEEYQKAEYLAQIKEYLEQENSLKTIEKLVLEQENNLKTIEKLVQEMSDNISPPKLSICWKAINCACGTAISY